MKKRVKKYRPADGCKRPADYTPEDFLMVILEAGRKAFKGKRLDGPFAAAAQTMGTLTASKLLLRLQYKGGLEFTGEAHAWELMEQLSDDLAASYYDILVGDLEGVGSIEGLRLKGERPGLHLVKNRKTFYWCPTTIADTDESPIPPDWNLRELNVHADRIEGRIIRDLGKVRGVFSTAESNEQVVGFLIAETVALVAAAKLVLSVWGNGKLAAAFEHLAERVSEIEYERYHQ